jgi:hypothetical protein
MVPIYFLEKHQRCLHCRFHPLPLQYLAQTPFAPCPVQRTLHGIGLSLVHQSLSMLGRTLWYAHLPRARNTFSLWRERCDILLSLHWPTASCESVGAICNGVAITVATAYSPS